MGQIMLTRSKGSCAQFTFIYRSHSARELYSAAKLYFTADLYSATDRFPLHFFLWTSLALWSSWWAFGPCFSLGFLPHRPLGIDLQKWASTSPEAQLIELITILFSSTCIMSGALLKN